MLKSCTTGFEAEGKSNEPGNVDSLYIFQNMYLLTFNIVLCPMEN
jgi:hypothetical protein